ncbi:hypothetical protein SASPL_121178 [Salvia splendens]|uniref:Oberon coiled-coil region domain-containing protein n=1 Tax=Salvia splendens TaxID=180675 RepID=A0A8X8XRE5_SALSN|nr:hypothetical protein SASPL_121178 [Salvia splendens]
MTNHQCCLLENSHGLEEVGFRHPSHWSLQMPVDPNLHERGSNSDQVRESPSDSASSLETWPTADALRTVPVSCAREEMVSATCVICNTSDFEVNTCRWIGSDLCSHWTHIVPFEMDRLAWAILLKLRQDITMEIGAAEPIPYKVILMFFQAQNVVSSTELEDSFKNQDSEDAGRMLSPKEAFNRTAQEAVRKMEMVAEEKMQMRKKMQIDELESIVRLKQAEADMFEMKANEARREAERLRRIALAKTEKSEEHEAEAEKQCLFERIKLQERSRASQSSAGANESSSCV